MKPPLAENLEVLLVEPQSSGGFWHYACSLASALRLVGVQAELATEFPFEPLGGDMQVPVSAIAHRDSPNGDGRSMRRLGRFGRKLWSLNRLLRSRKVRLIQLHGPLGNFDFAFLRFLKMCGLKLVYTAHNPRPRDGRNRWLDRARYRQFDRIIALSRRGVEELVADGVEYSRVRFLPHGNYAAFCHRDSTSQQARQGLGLPESARVVLFFGGIAPYKGLDLLLEAFEDLVEDDDHLYLVIAGKPLEEFSAYGERIRSGPLTHRVISDLRYIPGTEVSKYFLAADVVALPYRDAYQSGILQLAYAFGRPVMVTNVGELGQMVREDETGVVAKELTPEAVAESIRQLFSSASAAGAMGARGRVLAETKYSWRRIAEAHKKIYQELTAH